MPVDFFYAYPLAVFFLFANAVFFFLFFALAAYRRRQMQRFAYGMQQRSTACYWIQSTLLMVAWGCGVLALMDPKGNPQYPEGKKGGRNHRIETETSPMRRPKEVIFLLDDSASMAVKDMRTGRSRLENAKETIDQLVSRLDGETVALYTFTSEADKLVPSTTDYIYIRLLLRNLEVNNGDTVGTDINKALKTAVEDYRDMPMQAYKYVILLSDGGDTTLDALTKEEIEKSVAQMTAGIAELTKEHWKIYTVGVGTVKGGVVPDVVYQGKPVTSILEPALLRSLAAKGGGTYEALDTTTTSAWAEKMAKTINDDSPFLSPHEVAAPGAVKESVTVVYDAYYRYPLFIAIFALLGALFFPDAFVRVRPQ